MRVSISSPQPIIYYLKNYFPLFLFKILIGFVIFIAFILGYTYTATPITLMVNNTPLAIRTHRLNVKAVLLQLGLTINPYDTLWPPPESGLEAGQSISIQLARPIIIDTGDAQKQKTIFTHQQTPSQIYAELGISIAPADDLYVDGVLWEATHPIPTTLKTAAPKTAPFKTQMEALRPKPIKLTLHQAIPIEIIDDNNEESLTIFTTEQTVGDVLLTQNIPLYLGDLISPNLSTALTPNTIITIKRSFPVSILVDGKQIKTRTRYPTVAEVLAQEKIVLVGQDYTEPPENSQISVDTNINVIRVVEMLEVEQKTTDYETIWVPDHELDLDVQQLQQEGKQGVTKTRTRVLYKNGQEASRVEEETWLAQEASDKIIAYGTKVTVRTLETPDGTIEYWRKIRMLATAYTAATSGKTRDHPAYGITRSGMQAGFGIVAVDPGVIPLLTELYVTGYGQAIAGDTGGLIIGRHIDLGYDEDEELPQWYTWIDVYVLTPVPPSHKIRYVLPQWPQER